jgi:NADPH:quinone reductase
MKAAWYERQGPAREVLVVGDMPGPVPAAGEVRIRIAVSGINPGDIKKRENAFGYGMAYPRVIPHSDGAGRVDQLGAGVSSEWIGRAVWCYGAQSYRPFGTAAEFTVVPVDQVAPLPENVSMEQGACLGIPGITAHRSVHVAGAINGRTLLVQGAAGSVGLCAVQLARFAGARVIGTVKSPSDEVGAKSAGAHDVVLSDNDLVARVRAVAPEGIDHIVFFLGSDDFPKEAKMQAARDLNAALEAGWPGFEIGEAIPLADIARAHELLQHPVRRGRIVVTL